MSETRLALDPRKHACFWPDSGNASIYAPRAGLQGNFSVIAHMLARHQPVLGFSFFLYFRHPSIKVNRKDVLPGGNSTRPGYQDCQDCLAQCLVSLPAAVAVLSSVQLEELQKEGGLD